MTRRTGRIEKPFSGLESDSGGVPILSPGVVRRLRSLVYGYFRTHGRSFPWRESSDPYHILVSELMLQQTQTARVAERFPMFVERFPNLASLATAGTRDLLEAWRGLGYNRRALALREAARIIGAEHGGHVPRDPEILRGLPGVGPATASEIAAFAYEVPSAFVETNIRRVFLHFFFPGRHGVRDRQILPLVDRTMDRKHPRLWYYALMDYGVMMKKVLPAASPDPNHRSAHYARQSRFEGSDRQIRGRILRILGDGRALSAAELARRLGALHESAAPRYRGRIATAVPVRGRLAGILAKLREEGFLARDAARMRLP
jgi:A/G-specific adenine glycosylase